MDWSYFSYKIAQGVQKGSTSYWRYKVTQSFIFKTITGECKGTGVSEVKPSDSKEQCLIYCKEIEECQWFTFLSEFQVSQTKTINLMWWELLCLHAL